MDDVEEAEVTQRRQPGRNDLTQGVAEIERVGQQASGPAKHLALDRGRIDGAGGSR
jgi:hypothetical protein